MQDVLVDLEGAAINPFHLIDENINMKGCLYHLSSNIWKKIQHFGFQQMYNEDQEFTLHNVMLCAVAFMPPDNVIAGFEELSDLIRDTYQGEMDDLLDYFEETYFGWYRRNAERRPPLFVLNLRNIFHRTFDELPRTNNHVEGWHRRFQAQVSLCHPVFRKFINLLRTEENIVRMEIIQNFAGHPPRALRKRYVDANQRILAIMDEFQNRGNME